MLVREIKEKLIELGVEPSTFARLRKNELMELLEKTLAEQEEEEEEEAKEEKEDVKEEEKEEVKEAKEDVKEEEKEVKEEAKEEEKEEVKEDVKEEEKEEVNKAKEDVKEAKEQKEEVKAETIIYPFAKRQEQKKMNVPKGEPFQFDIAHLTALDPNQYTEAEAQDENLLLQMATASISQMFSQLKTLEREDENRYKLPKDVISLPRSHPIPTEKPMTRWEAFKKEKGIKTEKKEKIVLDKATGEWGLRYGYKRANAPTKDWLIEVPNGYTGDPFAVRENKKKDALKEQKKRERRNKNRYERAKINVTNVTANGGYDKDRIKAALKVSEYPGSSASMNQFNKINNKPAIFEEGSKLPKIFVRNKGKQKKGNK